VNRYGPVSRNTVASSAGADHTGTSRPGSGVRSPAGVVLASAAVATSAAHTTRTLSHRVTGNPAFP